MFAGKTALITGASRGIGLFTALKLAKAGANVIGTSTSKNGVQSIQKKFTQEKLHGHACVLDVTDESSIEKLHNLLHEKEHTPSILVNNAGITKDKLLMRMQNSDWEDVINTNLNAVYKITKICLQYMIKKKYGRIINVSSVTAMSGNAGQTNYVASKAGIIGFTRALAKEIGSRGITVNAIAPGFIDTDMTKTLADTQKDLLLKQIPLGRFGDASEVAEAICFLASDNASYITGETINVSGGLYMG